MENSYSTIILSCKISIIKNEYYYTTFTDSFFSLVFSFFKLSFINLKPLYSQFKVQREITITSLFRKLTKIQKNNFKIYINRISDPLETCKRIISAKILIYQPIRNFIQCSPEVYYTSLTLSGALEVKER